MLQLEVGRCNKTFNTVFIHVNVAKSQLHHHVCHRSHTIGGLSSTATRDKLKVNEPVELPSFTVMRIDRNSGSENSDTLVSYLKKSTAINHKCTKTQPKTR